MGQLHYDTVSRFNPDEVDIIDVYRYEGDNLFTNN